jgi:hypothetical protein
MASGSERANRASSPMMKRVSTSDVPPAETSGSVTPVTGSRPTTYPMFIAAWPTSQTVMATLASWTNRSADRRAIRKPA